MKTKLLYEELLTTITKFGVKVRKDMLVKSRGGYCLLNKKKLIILNKTLPIESHASILARCISELGLIENETISPAVRKYIYQEVSNHNFSPSIEFIIDNNI